MGMLRLTTYNCTVLMTTQELFRHMILQATRIEGTSLAPTGCCHGKFMMREGQSDTTLIQLAQHWASVLYTPFVWKYLFTMNMIIRIDDGEYAYINILRLHILANSLSISISP